MLGLDPVEFKPDRSVASFSVIVILSAGFLCGLAPALRSSSAGFSLAGATRESAPRRAFGNALVSAQIALSLILVVGASLLTRSMLKLLDTDVGFERGRVLVAAVIPTFLGYEGAKELRLYETLLGRINALPGVESATLSRLRLFQGHWQRRFSASERLPDSQSPQALCHPIGPRFFETMRIPKLLGREFSPADTERSTRVAIINEQVARTQFQSQNPLGLQIRFDEGDPYTVVGVVQNVKQNSMREDPPRMAVYIPYTQAPAEILGQMTIEIRTAAAPLKVAAALRQAVHSVDPDLPLINVETQADAIAAQMEDERSLAQLVSAFGALALLLAAVGLYGTLSYSLARRTAEIGIRMAVGAARSDVFRMVLRETFALVLAGLALGVPAALAGARLIANRLFGVTAADPGTFLFAAGLLAAVSAISAFLPAHRAARVDPLVALRWE